MMLVRDIMTVRVIALDPEDTIATARSRFLERGIGGAPVTRDGMLLGILSKTDLIDPRMRDDVRVRDVMTCEVVTFGERMSVAQAARLLLRHSIHRAPVVRGSRVVGMVTRSDLLRPYARTDGEIQADIEHDIVARALDSGPDLIHVRVLDGVVFLEGAVRDEREHAAARRLTVATPGVVDLVDHLQIAPMTVERHRNGGRRRVPSKPSG